MAEIEGFLCPLCMHDCSSVQELEDHYRAEHDESSQSGTTKFKNDVISFFEQVGNSLKIDSSPPSSRLGARSISCEDGAAVLGPVTNVSGIEPSEWDPQEIGRVAVHSIEFRRIRDAYLEDVTMATNRLISHLEKLFRMLQDTTTKTSKQIKSMEQNIVPWKRDKEEKNCNGCGQTFGLRRRRHHCRLCGEIRCKECCRFKTFLDTYPLLQGCPDYQDLAPPEIIPKKKFNLKLLERGASVDSDSDMSDEVRVCVPCKKLLERRLLQLGPTEKKTFVALYNKMTLTMEETEKLKPDFLEVARVVWSGDPGPTLEEASIQRQNLLRVYESVDVASKRILSIGSSDPSPLQQKLARNIRVFTSNYLQQHLLTLPSLPTKSQLQEIKDRLEREAQERQKEIERQQELQRQREEEQRLREEERQRLAAQPIVDIPDNKTGMEYLSEGFDKFTSDVDKLFSVNTLKDLGKEIKSIVPGEEAEVKTQVKTEGKAEAEVVKVKTDIKTEEKAEAKAEVKTEMTAEVKAERKEVKQEEKQEEKELSREEEEGKHKAQKQSEVPSVKTPKPEEQSGLDYFSANFKKFTSDVDRFFSLNSIRDLGKEIQNLVPGEENK